jgi:hypothetical protein
MEQRCVARAISRGEVRPLLQQHIHDLHRVALGRYHQRSLAVAVRLIDPRAMIEQHLDRLRDVVLACCQNQRRRAVFILRVRIGPLAQKPLDTFFVAVIDQAQQSAIERDLMRTPIAPQQPHAIGIPRGRSEPCGIMPRRIDCAPVDAASQQHLQHRRVAIPLGRRSLHQGRSSAAVARIQICAMRKKQPHLLRMAMPRRALESRRAALARRIDLRAMLEQKPHNGSLLGELIGQHREWRPAILVTRIDLRPTVEQQLHHR